MTPWQPYARREAALAEIERRIESAPDDVELRLARADLLAELGRGQAAQAAYLDVLARRPDDRRALNNFGALAHAGGFRSAARTLYAEAVRHHPGDPQSNVNLGNALAEAGEADGARQAFEAALTAAPDFGPAHRGLARLAGLAGDAAAAARHLAAAFAQSAIITRPYLGQGAPVEVLALISGVEGDIPLDHVLDPTVFRVTALAPEFFPGDQAPPTHQVIFNTIGDADLCGPALAAAQRLVRRMDRPVLNPPAAVLATGRLDNARRLGGLEDVITAPAASLSRDEVAALAEPGRLTARGLSLPIGLRALGFHAGRNFERADQPDQIGAILARLPGEALLAMSLLDTRGADGLYRKYRVMAVDGRLWPLHLAISRQWKVHYFSADMAERPDHRAEEAAFLADMPKALGARAMAALARIVEALGLDYGGMDFCLDGAGRVILFEANATMLVPSPDGDPRWDYRRAPVDAILAATRAMVTDRARLALSPPPR